MPVEKLAALDWDNVQTFLVLAETGSYSAAARRLGLTHATIARRIELLERSLGGRAVVERIRSGCVASVLGEQLLGAARDMAAAALVFQRRAVEGDELVGRLRISTLPTFAERVLAPRLAQLSIAHPGLEIELIGEDRNISIARDDVDIAVRFGRPDSGVGKVRRLGFLGWSLYATARYFADHAAPDWRFVGFSAEQGSVPAAAQLGLLAQGRPTSVRCNGSGPQLQAAAAGAGVAFLPHYLGDTDARLVRATIAEQPWLQPIWLLVREDAARLPRVRLVLDHVAAAAASLTQTGSDRSPGALASIL